MTDEQTAILAKLNGRDKMLLTNAERLNATPPQLSAKLIEVGLVQEENGACALTPLGEELRQALG